MTPSRRVWFRWMVGAAILATAQASHGKTPCPPTDSTATPEKSTAEAAVACAVTSPNGDKFTSPPSVGNHGNSALVTDLRTSGEVVFKPGGAGCQTPDGALAMKWPWWRRLSGPLSIEGRRLDATAPPLRAHIPSGYGPTGFQVSGLIFPTDGCWEVTGRVSDQALTFVTAVEKIGEGPPACQSRFTAK